MRQTIRLLIVLVLLLTTVAEARAQGDSQTFPQTGKTVGGRFLSYWQQHGGLAQQGYPIAEEFNERSDLNDQQYRVQYFERAVFEYHPENAGTAYEVLLSQLGTFQYRKKYAGGAPGQQTSASNPTLFKETGKTLGGKFRSYWEMHGGLAQQGFPISNEFSERSDLDGKSYLVQYFERAVFEYHPENAGTEYEVLLSQLGTFQYRKRYVAGEPAGDKPLQLGAARLLGLDMRAGSEEGWAVGDGGIILHYSGGKWLQAPSPTGRTLYAVSLPWAVGEGGIILKYDGSSWQQAASPTGETLRAVATGRYASEDGWAVGGGTILHYSGGKWQIAARLAADDLRGVAAQGAAGLAVGSTASGEVATRALQLGSKIVPLTVPARQALYAVGYASNPATNSKARAVGEGGTTLSFDGSSWQPEATSTTEDLNGIYLGEGGTWAVGNAGTILQRSDNGWVAVASPTQATLNGVVMLNAGEGWAVGYGTILHYQNGKWSKYQ